MNQYYVFDSDDTAIMSLLFKRANIDLSKPSGGSPSEFGFASGIEPTASMIAIHSMSSDEQEGLIERLKQLRAKGADTTTVGHAHVAIHFGLMDVLGFLTSTGTTLGRDASWAPKRFPTWSTFFTASMSSSPEIVEMLVEKYGGREAVVRNNLVNIAAGGVRNLTPFIVACGLGDVAMMRCLAAFGADPFHCTADGRNALHCVCTGRDYFSKVGFSGAQSSSHVPLSVIDFASSDDRVSSKVDALEALRDILCGYNKPTQGGKKKKKTSKSQREKRGVARIQEMANLGDDEGVTALHLAARFADVALASCLVERFGADSTARSATGASCIYFAAVRSRWHTVWVGLTSLLALSSIPLVSNILLISI